MVIKKIKIIIADYSSFSRLVLSDILNTEVDLEVMDTAENGEELLQKIKEHTPDLVIADYHLPKNSRMFTFRRIQQEFKVPILGIIGTENLPEDFIFEALKVGVYDFVHISSYTGFPQFRKIQDEIIQKVRAVMDIKHEQLQIYQAGTGKRVTDASVINRNTARFLNPSSYVVMGASTGGTKALEAIIKDLSVDLSSAVLIAVHLPGKFTRTFTQRLKGLTALKVVEGKTGTRLEAGKIIVAPGDKNMIVNRHMGIKTDLRVDFSLEPSHEFDRPSVDLLMKSVAKVAGANTLGVILTGMGKDGTAGAKAIIGKGGETVAQDEASSAIFGMAKSAIDKGYISKVISLTQIPEYINRFAEYHRI
ncbi:chemotaxis protein CheB [Adhaeribacter aquaticus]|uniref:chemotaxis protein CheB n=1 Tax=Adhaeribacter aquaticus TaxID=299567 RepID=UPI000421C6A5|nr:chemotaxis protein CheB [Adhaeribacter aquaticus]